MTDVLDRLKTALADRYTIERELGSGGMTTVVCCVSCHGSHTESLRCDSGAF